MGKFYETTARYLRMGEGAPKRVTEKYLVSADTCTDAEARLMDELGHLDELEVRSVTEREIADVVNVNGSEGDRWYMAKVMLVTVDEKTGKDKKTAHLMMVLDSGIDGALKSVNDAMRGCMTDWEVASVSLTQIVEVFTFGE